MQAKGISLTMLGVETPSTKQNIQANDRVFTDIMTNISEKKENKQLSLKQSEHLSSNKVNKKFMKTVSEQPVIQNVSSKADQKVELVPMSEESIQKVVNELETLVENTFGLSEEEDVNVLAGIMEQMLNLFFPPNETLVENPSFEETSVNEMDAELNDLTEINVTDLKVTDFMEIDKEQLKNLVLEFHGIEDSSALLTNTDLMQEFDALTEGMEDMLRQLDENLLPEENQDKILSVSEQVVVPRNDETDETIQNMESDKSTLDVHNSVDVSFSTETSGQNETNLNQSNDNETLHNSESKTTVTDKKTQGRETTQNPVDTFVAKINEAFENLLEKSGQTTHTSVDIVNQVVNHIRVRVLPETTSMELTLNPQHLGKLNIAISSTNGVAKATMTVQSEAAKEALESQLITLKETFAEKGIKVVSVEVNVSEFGFKNESDGKGEQNKARQSGSKKIRLDKFEDDDEAVVEAEASRTENSTIDYIA